MELKIQVLRQEVKQFSKIAPRVVDRLLALIELTKCRQKYLKARDVDFERIAARFEISSRSLRRWDSYYLESGVEGLFPVKQSGRPPHAAIRGHTARKIRDWRKRFNWGAEVIQAHLRLDHGIVISKYKINRFLAKKGLLVRKICKTRKKHKSVVQVEHPGHHTQIDVKHLPHILADGKKCYNYNFVDHASKWAFKYAYDSYGPSETRDFMERLIRQAPFTIVRAQTDNGVEFTNKFLSHLDSPKAHALGTFCDAHSIRHVLIPPGEKELQGLVERSHRQDDEELFHRITPKNLADLNEQIVRHCTWRNSKRRRKALGWKTSDEFLSEYRQKIESWIYENAPSPFRPQPIKEPAEETYDLDKKAA